MIKLYIQLAQLDGDQAINKNIKPMPFTETGKIHTHTPSERNIN